MKHPIPLPPNTEPMFCMLRLGNYPAVQVSIVSLKKKGLAVRCHTWDRDLGGRDIDELLYDHFCQEFQGKFKIDVRSNAKASFKLRTQCERLKKVGLRVVGQPRVVVEYVVEWCGLAIELFV